MFDQLFEINQNDIFKELRDSYFEKNYEQLKFQYKNLEYVEIVIHTDKILAYLWERLHDGKWLDIHPNYRYFYGYMSALHGYYSWITSNSHSNSEFILKLFRLLDLGILLGSSHSLKLIQEIISMIQSSSPIHLPLMSNFKYLEKIESTIPMFQPMLRNNLPVEDCLNLLTFSEKYFHPQRPVVIRNSIQHWPALNLWNDLEYINSGIDISCSAL